MFRKISEISKEELEIIIKESNSITEALTKCNLRNIKGRNRSTFKKKCEAENLIIEFNQLKIRGMNTLIHKKSKSRLSQKELLVKDCKFGQVSLRRLIRRDNLLENKCSICNLLPLWNNQVLVLQIDHINGINNDNRLENLRLLCPNCHSQTANFSGRANKK